MYVPKKDLKYYIANVIRVGHKLGEWHNKGKDELRQWCSDLANWCF
jgi:hypothetical protein